jgi:murein DD-endopeptidase MepM/ murein hydrolase activator NlpD
MRSAGKEGGVADRQTHLDEGAEPGGNGGSGSFDPGLETGYLRRAGREGPLPVEIGAVPFDPGSGTGYDGRRARRTAKRREREERKRLEEERREREQSKREARLALLREARKPREHVEPAPAEPPPPSQSQALLDHEGARQHEHAQAPHERRGDWTEAAPDEEAAIELEAPPEHGGRRHSLADRIEREREQREHAETERRARIERERAQRERAEREQRAERRRQREERLRRAREARRARVAHRTTPVPRRRDLVGPTARAGLAVTVVLAVAGALGSVLGLPVPGLDAGSGGRSLLSSASLFGVDAGTPPGLATGYVFPLIGPHNFGDKGAQFGASRYGHVHEGQDIFGKAREPEIAVHDGVVVDRGKTTNPDAGGRGNYLVIYSPAEDQSYVYMHMLKPSPVLLDQSVNAGQEIGQLGCTGSCEGPHLHFEVRIGKASFGADTRPIDPLPLLRQWPDATPG